MDASEDERMARAAAAISRARHLVVFSGAGMSKECGIDTFRGEGGVWERVSSDDLATMAGFIRDPVLVWRWYEGRRLQIAQVEPHAGYRALGELETLIADVVTVTQNIDGLHARSGARRVIELHGSIWKVRCAAEDNEPWEDRRVPLPELPPRCACGGLIRPHVVWFGEPLDPRVLEDATEAASRCDVMLVLGTSAVVHPAAGLPLVAKRAGAFLVEVNPQETPLSRLVDVRLGGRVGEVLPGLVAQARRAEDGAPD
jgi:NAD-dependent deacetylase